MRLLEAINDRKKEDALGLLRDPEYDVNERDHNDYNKTTALIRAIQTHQEDIALLIIKHPKCDVNLQTHYGYTALIRAIIEKQENIATQLLQHPQCDVNLQTHYGHTALIRAIIEKQENIATQLLQLPQCDVNLQTHYGHTALIRAIIEKQENIANQLLQHPQCDVNLQNRDGNTALIIAIEWQQENIATQLLQHPQCDVNLQNRDGNTALIIAIEWQQENIATQLLQHPQCDVNLQAQYGNTPLLLAIIKNQKNVILALIQHLDCELSFKVENIRRRRELEAELESHIDLLLSDPESIVTGQLLKHVYKEKNITAQMLERIIEHPNFVLQRLRDIELQNANYSTLETVLRNQSRKGRDATVATLLNTFDTLADFKFTDPSLALWCINKASDPFAVLKTFKNLKNFVLDVKTKDDLGDTLITSFLRTWGNVGYVREEIFYSKMVTELTQGSNSTRFPRLFSRKTLPNRRLLPAAIKYSATETCQKIIQIGCDLKGTFDCQENAVFCSIRLEALNKLKLLGNERSLMSVKWEGMYPLEYSVAYGLNHEITRYLATKSHLGIKVRSYLKRCSKIESGGNVTLYGIDNSQLSVDERLTFKQNMAFALTKFGFHGDTLLQTARRLNLVKETETGVENQHDDVTNMMITTPSTKLKACKCLTNPHEKIDDEGIEQLILSLNIANGSLETLHILSCLNALFNEVMRRMRKKKHPFEFTWSLVGSVGEATKSHPPDEADLLCLIDGDFAIEPIESKIECFSPKEKTMPHIKTFHVRATNKRWKQFCKSKSNFLSPHKIWRTFHSAVDAELTDMYNQGISFGNLFLHRKSIEYREKISCLQLMWRGRQFRHMVIHVDLVPALPCTDKDFDHLITKVSRHDPEQSNSGFSRSYSNIEIDQMLALPLELRQAYTYAKALRMKCISNPKDLCSKHELHLVQDRRVDDIITSFMLKTITFSLEIDKLLGKNVHHIAKDIYLNLRNEIEKKEMKTQNGDIVFQCSHNHHQLASCCIHRKLILAICDEITFFLKGADQYTNISVNSNVLMKEKQVLSDTNDSDQTDPISEDQVGRYLLPIGLEKGLEYVVQLQSNSLPSGEQSSSDNDMTISMLRTCAIDLATDKNQFIGWDKSHISHAAKCIYMDLRDRVESKAEVKSKCGKVLFHCSHASSTGKKCCKKRQHIRENCYKMIDLISKLIQREKFLQMTQNRVQVYSRNASVPPLRNMLQPPK